MRIMLRQLKQLGYAAAISALLAGCSPGLDYKNARDEKLTAIILHATSFGPWQ